MTTACSPAFSVASCKVGRTSGAVFCLLAANCPRDGTAVETVTAGAKFLCDPKPNLDRSTIKAP